MSMTLFNRLKDHVSGLIRIKTELYWYTRGSWDKKPGRVCLVMNVSYRGYSDATTTLDTRAARKSGVWCLLLIDGNPYRVWLTDKDIDLLAEGDQ